MRGYQSRCQPRGNRLDSQPSLVYRHAVPPRVFLDGTASASALYGFREGFDLTKINLFLRLPAKVIIEDVLRRDT